MSLNRIIVAGVTPISASDINGIQAVWDAYTPVATNFTVGSGALTGRYLRIGKLAIVRVNFTAGGTSAFTGSGATVSLPFAAQASGEQDVELKLGSSSGVITTGIGNIVAGGTVFNLFVPTAAGTSTLGAMSTGTLNPGTTGNFVIYGTIELA